ncbi:MAG: hypothetical protein JO358_21890 [Alphaproteobacteria bacterium]|nr:hypothetical protein [Alphaproteobacteria bacterium]
MFRPQPVPLATALLATGSACVTVDAHHIAAIDNATRKLMSTRQAARCGWLILCDGGVLRPVQSGRNVIATGVSALFLFAIATANLIILRGA